MSGGPLRVAIVTGASSGIGLCVARALAKEGFALMLAARDATRLNAAAASLAVGSGSGASIAIRACDIGDEPQARALIDAAIARFGRLDALINNAGVAPLTTIEKHDARTIREAFGVNAIGPANAIAQAWPYFVKQRRGVIVNVSSLATKSPFPGFFAYAASKASVNLMARSCAIEGAPHNIRAFAVAPGAVETPMLRAMFDDKAIPKGACLSPGAVADIVVDCVLGRRDGDNGETIYLSA